MRNAIKKLNNKHKDLRGSVKIDLRPRVENSSFFTTMEKNRENNTSSTKILEVKIVCQIMTTKGFFL